MAQKMEHSPEYCRVCLTHSIRRRKAADQGGRRDSKPNRRRPTADVRSYILESGLLRGGGRYVESRAGLRRKAANERDSKNQIGNHSATITARWRILPKFSA